MRKDLAYEIASTIIAARQRLVSPISIQKSSSIIDKKSMSHTHINDDTSISSGIVTGEDSTVSESISDDDEDVIRTKKNKNRMNYSSQRIMNRITTYLSEVDWRVFNYITKNFLQNGDCHLVLI
jgi:hypothetical protein